MRVLCTVQRSTTVSPIVADGRWKHTSSLYTSALAHNLWTKREALNSAPVGLISMKLICCIALLTSGESYFKQLTANNQLGLIAGTRSSNTKISRTSLYEASTPVDGSLSPDIPSNQVILLRESSQTSLHGGQDDEDAKCKISPIFHAYLQLEDVA